MRNTTVEKHAYPFLIITVILPENKLLFYLFLFCLQPSARHNLLINNIYD